MTDKSKDLNAVEDNEQRTTLSLSLTVSDKKALKMLAAKQGTTIAAIIHTWIQKYIEENESTDR